MAAKLLNNRVDAVVTAVFLLLVTIVANARMWWQLVSGRQTSQLLEEPYVAAGVTETV